MPYRRLPNTDNARIRALKTAIEQKEKVFNNDFLNFNIQVLRGILRKFESSQILYRESLNKQAAENRKFQNKVKNARLYISHFIQVLNLCVIRHEIKKDTKSLYKLDPDNFAVPDLTSNDAVMLWGENIMKGEQDRVQQGGAPIYNPTIARVNVAFSMFKDGYIAQKTFQNITARQLDNLSQQREDIDKIICDLWNQIEAAFADLPNDERLEKCREFGVVYYLRREEKLAKKHVTEEADD